MKINTSYCLRLYAKAILFFLVSSIFNSTEVIGQQGTLELKTQRFAKDGSLLRDMSMKIWYKDSIVVEQLKELEVNKDGFGVESPGATYLFINLSKKMAYEYSDFSKTAKLLSSSSLNGNPQLMGWDFYSARAQKVSGTPEVLKDTVIKSINYRQIKCHFLNNSPKEFAIALLRCDGQKALLSLEKDYCKQSRCTMIKSIFFESGNPNPTGVMELIELTKGLSKQELEIFDTWNKKALIKK
jgi:hypothetical protein